MLQTERLILREWKDSDIPAFTAMGQDPRVMEFFPNLWSEEKSRDAVAYFRQDFEQHGFGFFAVELKENHEFIGFVGLSILPFETHFTPAVEIGWRLASQHFGKGYATEAAREVLRFAFEELHLKEIVSFTVPANEPSQNVMKKIGIVWPNQQSYGTHINVSGGGLLKNAPHKEAAIAFLEYLTSDEAQTYFADGNNEWPVVAGTQTKNPALEALGKFKADALSVGALAQNTALVQKIYDRAGYR